MMHLPGVGPPAVRCIRQYPDAPAVPPRARTWTPRSTRPASGKTSSYYINSKRVLFHGEAVALLGELLYQATSDLSIQAIGGLEVGAIPMAAAVAMRYHQHGRGVEGFFVRKEAKGHGSKQRVEGEVKAGDRVAVIDDVLTTGGSVLQAVAEVEKVGARVERVV